MDQTQTTSHKTILQAGTAVRLRYHARLYKTHQRTHSKLTALEPQASSEIPPADESIVYPRAAICPSLSRRPLFGKRAFHSASASLTGWCLQGKQLMYHQHPVFLWLEFE